MSSRANMHLVLDNEPANVSLVREAISGVAEALSLDREALDDIKTAVSEACNNVVLHAYEGGHGPLEVEIFVRGGSLEVAVRDEGVGIRPRLPDDQRLQGVGLAVIQALSDHVEFVGGTGTTVRMSFSAAAGGLKGEVRATAAGADGDRAKLRPGEVVVSVSPTALAPTVFSRLAGALSARARFSIDRLSDAQLVTDALAGASDPVTLALSCEERRLDLRLGPLEPGRGERVLSERSVENLIAKLVDEIATERVDGREMLHLALNDQR